MNPCSSYDWPPSPEDENSACLLQRVHYCSLTAHKSAWRCLLNEEFGSKVTPSYPLAPSHQMAPLTFPGNRGEATSSVRPPRRCSRGRATCVSQFKQRIVSFSRRVLWSVNRKRNPTPVHQISGVQCLSRRAACRCPTISSFYTLLFFCNLPSLLTYL